MRIIPLLLAALCSAASQPAAPPATLPTSAPAADALRQRNIESFDVVWQTVKDNHYDPTLGGLDWNAVRDELRPKMQKATTLPQARVVLREMLDRLNQTHFEIMAPDGYQEDDPSSEGGRDGYAGIHARVLGGKMLVTRVDTGSSAERLGVKPGWEIRAIDGEELAPQVARVTRERANSTLRDFDLAWLASAHLSGKVGEHVKVQFADGDDKILDLDISFAQRPGNRAQWTSLPPRYVQFEKRRIGDDVGYIRFNTWLDPLNFVKFIDGTMAEFANTRGIVIDLRGARGGLGHLPPFLARVARRRARARPRHHAHAQR